MTQPDDFNFGLLKRLCEAPGTGGREEAVRAVTREALAGFVDEISTDHLGNLIGVKHGSGGPKVMLAAHMDEIGFLVKYIDERGFLRLQPVGWFDPRILPAQRVVVQGFAGEPLVGALMLETKPFENADSRKNAPKLEQIFVDLGLPGDVVKTKVEIGDMVTLERSCERVGNMVMGKAVDDRVGVFQMIEALARLAGEQVPATIYAVATTQEEEGARGAFTVAEHLNPDIGVALDVTTAADIPGVPDQDAVTRVGEGAAIKIYDNYTVSNQALYRHVRRIAEENGIKHQLEVLPAGGTDAEAMQRARAGVPVITLSIPTRYLHTVNEMAAVSDIQAGIDLLVVYLRNAHRETYTPE